MGRMRVTLIILLFAIVLFVDFLIYNGTAGDYLALPTFLQPLMYFILGITHIVLFVLLFALWSKRS